MNELTEHRQSFFNRYGPAASFFGIYIPGVITINLIQAISAYLTEGKNIWSVFWGQWDEERIIFYALLAIVVCIVIVILAEISFKNKDRKISSLINDLKLAQSSPQRATKSQLQARERWQSSDQITSLARDFRNSYLKRHEWPHVNRREYCNEVDSAYSRFHLGIKTIETWQDDATLSRLLDLTAKACQRYLKVLREMELDEPLDSSDGREELSDLNHLEADIVRYMRQWRKSGDA